MLWHEVLQHPVSSQGNRHRGDPGMCSSAIPPDLSAMLGAKGLHAVPANLCLIRMLKPLYPFASSHPPSLTNAPPGVQATREVISWPVGGERAEALRVC